MQSGSTRAAVQHLALFVPWQSLLGESVGDDNDIWGRKRLQLSPQIFLVDNIQLLRRSAEDVKSDARQWAASSGEGDVATDGIEQDTIQRDQDNSENLLSIRRWGSDAESSARTLTRTSRVAAFSSVPSAGKRQTEQVDLVGCAPSPNCIHGCCSASRVAG